MYHLWDLIRLSRTTSYIYNEDNSDLIAETETSKCCVLSIIPPLSSKSKVQFQIQKSLDL